MNFLAHAFLAHPSIPLIIGNFIGDFVKGKQVNTYEREIANGIMMHRRIDEFTDNHFVFKKSKGRISKKYGHYSGVVIDLYYDHFLAITWEEFTDIKFDLFVSELYQTILKNEDLLPEKAKMMLPYMIKYDWLSNYATIDGIDKSLKGLAKRTRFDSKMEDAAEDLIQNYESIKNDFRDFFPEIISSIKN